jgi:glycine/D-amino acid oxidase-like deaminating enzyme/nitrite reductase/ring-hydroxylating ferredoxin subunit
MRPAENLHTKSIWMRDHPLLDYPKLQSDLSCEVCVIGAGIAGLMSAYQLQLAGKSVIVLDDQTVASGESGRTTAHLTYAIDTRYHDLIRTHGMEAARMIAESHRTAIDTLEKITAVESIDCDFERLDGYLFSSDGSSIDELREEEEALRRLSITGPECIDLNPLPLDSGAALKFPNQAQFHPLKFLTGLAERFVRKGGRIFSYAHATEFVEGDPIRVQIEAGYSVVARDVIVAAHTPVNDRIKIHTKQAPYRTYAIATEVPFGYVPRGLYWDTASPYHYVRYQGPNALIIGGEDHKTGQGEVFKERFQNLLRWTRQKIFKEAVVRLEWSGQILEPNDGVALIGKNPYDKHNVYIATGFSGNGMTYGTIAGLLLRDLVLGRENPWADYYEPSRKRFAAAGDFLSENLNVARQYATWASGGDVKTLEEIPPGEGAVVRKGIHKLAVFRDETGHFHARSAKCTHLGCAVRWNSAEKSWDCPCHGSRFEISGKVINGPAVTPLAPLEEDEEKEISVQSAQT